MSRPDHAALQHSDLNPFLFADVGKELNGSTLTMLSVLARLGEDPWLEAGRWAKLPKAAAVECLVTTIAGFPLAPETGSDPRAVATRLVLLLPAQEWLPDLKTAPFPMAADGGACLRLGPRPRRQSAPHAGRRHRVAGDVADEHPGTCCSITLRVFGPVVSKAGASCLAPTDCPLEQRGWL